MISKCTNKIEHQKLIIRFSASNTLNNKLLLTLSGWRQQDIQYSYILQHPFSLQVSQVNLFVFSEPVLQQPDGIKSDLEHTYPLSSTIKTLPCTEFLQVTIFKLVWFPSVSECHKNELRSFLLDDSKLLSFEGKSAEFY